MEAIEIIKHYIGELGITQTKLAALSGLSYGTVNRVLNRKQEIKPNTLKAIAEALNLPLHELLNDTSKEVIVPEVQGYIEYDGEIIKIKSFANLQKMYKRIEHETQVLPKEVKGIIALNKRNQASVSSHPNQDFQFDLDWESEGIYDATKIDCWGFKTSEDEKDGVVLDLGNQCSGYPFLFHGNEFFTSESAYLCGQFSLNSEECKRIQYQLLYERNGYTAKKKVKNANRKLIRQDWSDIMADWMLYVIWAKCRGNEDFANKLKSIPRDAVIIENSTTIHEGTSVDWGSKNSELEEAREKVSRYAELKYLKEIRQGKRKRNQSELDEVKAAARNEIQYIGTFSGGRNLMGKVLKRCQLALLSGMEPEINYELLRSKQIYLFGQLLTFQD